MLKAEIHQQLKTAHLELVEGEEWPKNIFHDQPLWKLHSWAGIQPWDPYAHAADFAIEPDEDYSETICATSNFVEKPTDAEKLKDYLCTQGSQYLHSRIVFDPEK